MARTMSKTNTKSVEKSSADEVILDVIETKTKKVVEKKFNDDDMIPCRSITNGKLIMEGRSGNVYRWQNYGDTEYVTYKDLRVATQNSSPSSYVYSPRFIIEDEEFISEFNKLRDFYDSLYTTDDLRQILTLPIGQMKEVVEELPNGCKESLKSLASSMIREGALDSVRKIKLLDEVFGTQLFLTATED